MKLRILGCGTSSGVPRIGNDWGTCDPANPHNARTRASVLISTQTTSVLIDTSPDMRAQLLAADVDVFDAVLWTHDHADHCHGIDDLRQIFHVRGGPVDGYARPETLQGLQHRFAYAFFGRDGYPPTIIGRELPDRLILGDISMSIIDQPHGNITSAGIRFDSAGTSFAYSTDINDLTDDIVGLFQGVDVWIVDALRTKPHPTHAHLEQTLGWIARVKPRRAVLTHMDQTMDYATLAETLPAHVVPAYDGLEIDLG